MKIVRSKEDVHDYDFQLCCYNCQTIFKFDKRHITSYNCGEQRNYVICPGCSKWLNITAYEKDNAIKYLKGGKNE